MKKAGSILLIICTLMMQVSCSTTKLLSMEDASNLDIQHQSLVLHTPTKIYYLCNYKFFKDSVQGELKEYSGRRWKTLHVYCNENIKPESSQKTNQIITLKELNMDSIKYINRTSGNVSLIVGGVVVGLVVLFISTFTYDMDMNFTWGGW